MRADRRARNDLETKAVKMGRLSIASAMMLDAAAILAGCAWQGDLQPVTINQTAVPPLPTLDAARLGRGDGLYAQHCSECHGTNLEGAPDWKRALPDGSYPPPPHEDSGHTWHHPDTLLWRIIVQGGDPAYNLRMPAFGATVTPDDVSSVLKFIKGRWGTAAREFRWWITETSAEPYPPGPLNPPGLNVPTPAVRESAIRVRPPPGSPN